MVKIPNQNRKYYLLSRIQGGMCACGCGRRLVDDGRGNLTSRSSARVRRTNVHFHHQFPNTKDNRAYYTLFIHSILNLQLVIEGHHEGFTTGAIGHITDFQAMKYESFLRRHPKISDWANGKTS